MVTLIDSYSESNKDDNFYLTHVFGGGDFYHDVFGQSFHSDNSQIVDSVKFYLSQVGDPPGNCYARIYSVSGTHGTDAVGDTLLATSDAVAHTTLEEYPSYNLVTFAFSGTNRITLDANTDYVVAVYTRCSGFTNNVVVGTDSSLPTHDGNSCSLDMDDVWTSYPYYSLAACFYVYGDVVAPTVSTTTTTLLNRTVATVGGNVTDAGSSAVTERGIYYGTDELSQTNKLVSSSGLGTYPIFLSGLTPNTKYYFKAFATSSIGTSYGDVLSFTTGNSLSVGDKTALPPFNRA